MKQYKRMFFYIRFVLIAVLHFFIVQYFATKFFFADHITASWEYIAFRASSIFLFWMLIARMSARFRSDISFRRYIYFCVPYFLFSLVLLLCIWPGLWVWDDLWVLSNLEWGGIETVQHVLIPMFYKFSMSLFPSHGMVLVCHVFCISLIVGYVIDTLFTILDRSRLALLGYLPFLLPAVLLINNYPLRNAMFAYLYMLFVAFIVRKTITKSSSSLKEVFFMAATAGCMSNLRGEGILYLALIPFVLFLASYRHKIIFIGIFFISFFIFDSVQSYYSSPDKAARYSLSTYVTPLSWLAKIDNVQHKTDALKNIEPVLDTEILLKTNTGAGAFFTPNFIKDSFYVKEYRQQLQNAYKELVVAYPVEFLRERWSLFYKQKSLINRKHTFIHSEFYQKLFYQNKFSRYLHADFRAAVLQGIMLLEYPLLFDLSINHKIPIVFLFGLFLLTLARRRYALAVICACPMFLTLACILTAPGNAFFYYFTAYLAGYLFFTVFIIRRLVAWRLK